MIFKYGFAATVTCITLLSPISSFSMPTEKYPTHLDLLKKEKKMLKKEAIYYSAMPLPIPVVSNAISGSTAWNKYYKCNKMYLYFKSARIIYESEHGINDYKSSKQKKAHQRLLKLIEKLKKESEEKKPAKTGLVGRSESQKQLDERIKSMTVSELASLLYRADKCIPPSCGNPFAGTPNIRGYNLRYRLRTASLYNSGQSILEDEIAEEEAKIALKTEITQITPIHQTQQEDCGISKN